MTVRRLAAPYNEPHVYRGRRVHATNRLEVITYLCTARPSQRHSASASGGAYIKMVGTTENRGPSSRPNVRRYVLSVWRANVSTKGGGLGHVSLGSPNTAPPVAGLRRKACRQRVVVKTDSFTPAQGAVQPVVCGAESLRAKGSHSRAQASSAL